MESRVIGTRFYEGEGVIEGNLSTAEAVAITERMIEAVNKVKSYYDRGIISDEEFVLKCYEVLFN